VTDVGITGHQRLPRGRPNTTPDAEAQAWAWVRAALNHALSEISTPLVGHSALVVGADQIFADVVLERGGTLRVVRPFADYDKMLEGDEKSLATYRRLLQRAGDVEDIKGASSRDDAYLLAGQAIVLRSQLMLAVWDRGEPRSLGGTANVVRFARDRGCPVIVIDPITRVVSPPE